MANWSRVHGTGSSVLRSGFVHSRGIAPDSSPLDLDSRDPPAEHGVSHRVRRRAPRMVR